MTDADQAQGKDDEEFLKLREEWIFKNVRVREILSTGIWKTEDFVSPKMRWFIEETNKLRNIE